MARLLVGADWYESLASTAYYEFEFEALIAERATSLFPGWVMVPFKATVESEDGIRKPDYALVDPKYRSWWVVEVELAHHSLEGHVLPQVGVFASGIYTSQHARYLAAHDESLDEMQLRAMMRGEQPSVLVVVNQPVPEWIPRLAQVAARVMVVEAFRSHRNTVCLRINGHSPRQPQDIVTELVRYPLLARTMIVASPAGLGGEPGDIFLIEIDDAITEWIRVETGDRVLLRSRKQDPLAGIERVQIVRRLDGRLAVSREER